MLSRRGRPNTAGSPPVTPRAGWRPWAISTTALPNGVKAHKAGTFTEDMIDYPTVEAGIQGLKYVEACLESNQKGNIWVTL